MIKHSCLVLSLASLAVLSLTQRAHAQYSYMYYPNNTTINSDVTPDFAIVGYAGGSYNNDFTRNFTGASSPTIQIVDGANIIGEVDSFNSSTVNITGGNVAFVAPYDTSVVNISGSANVGFALNDDNSVIRMTGGYVSELDGQGKSVSVSGGQVDTLFANTNTSAFGNTVGGCTVDVTGGSFGDIFSYNDGILNFRGGTFSGTLIAAYGGTLNIFGSNLTATLINPNYSFSGGSTYGLYALSGTLADGNLLTNQNFYIRNDQPGFDGSVGHSSFHLILTAAPEPGVLALISTGLLPLAGAFLRQRRFRIYPSTARLSRG